MHHHLPTLSFVVTQTVSFQSVVNSLLSRSSKEVLLPRCFRGKIFSAVVDRCEPPRCVEERTGCKMDNERAGCRTQVKELGAGHSVKTPLPDLQICVCLGP